MKLAALLILLLFQAPGLDIKQPPKVTVDRLNINEACKPLMMALEGVTSEIADAIISGRPYQSVNEVKGKIPKEVWEKISPKLAVKGGSELRSPFDSPPICYGTEAPK